MDKNLILQKFEKYKVLSESSFEDGTVMRLNMSLEANRKEFIAIIEELLQDQWIEKTDNSNWKFIGMNYDEFMEFRDSFKNAANKLIKADGYASMSHVFRTVVDEVNKERKKKIGNPENPSFYSSISALLIKNAKNIREPLFDKDYNLKNYHVLKNNLYGLNQTMKWATAAMALFAILSFGVSIMNLLATTNASNESHKNIIILPPHLQQLIDTSLKVQEYRLHDTSK